MKKTTNFLTTAMIVLVSVAGAYANGVADANNFAPLTATSSTTLTDVTPSRLWINLLNSDGNGAQTAIAYLEETTNGLDYGYDAARFVDPGTIGVYTICENAELVIQARPLFNDNDVVDLGYSVPVAGSYTFHLYLTTGVFTGGQKIYIHDTSNGTVTDITENDYTFETEVGKFNDRFKVIYQPVPLSVISPDVINNQIIVSSSQSFITIESGLELLSSVIIYDINGRILYNKKDINSNKLEIDDIKTVRQIVIARINTINGAVHLKKVLL